MIDDLIRRSDAFGAADKVYRTWHGGLIQDLITAFKFAIIDVPSAQPEIIRRKECMHNGSFDTDCPIDWGGKEFCSFGERSE